MRSKLPKEDPDLNKIMVMNVNLKMDIKQQKDVLSQLIVLVIGVIMMVIEIYVIMIKIIIQITKNIIFQHQVNFMDKVVLIVKEIQKLMDALNLLIV